MATIISSGQVCDGFDVEVRLDDGRRHTFHFVEPPADVAAEVERLAAALPPPDALPAPPPADATALSPIEQEFRRQRDAAKLAAIEYMYNHPDCAAEDVIAAAGQAAPMLNGSVLLNAYLEQAFARGYITELSFEAFRVFILSTPPEVLMQL